MEPILTGAFSWNNVFVAIFAVAQAFTALMVYLNNKQTKELKKDTALLAETAEELNKRSASNANNIAKIEVATNSMKDELVKATDQAAFARGFASEGKSGVEVKKNEVKKTVKARAKKNA